MNAVRQLGTARLQADLVAGATLYCSAEPCAMCASAICAVGLRRVVFGLDWPTAAPHPPRPAPHQPELPRCVCQRHSPMECAGPCLVDEALAVYEDSWFSADDRHST